MARLKAWSGAQLVASQPNADQMARVDDRILRLAMRSPFRPSPPIKLSTTGKHHPRRDNRDSTIHARTSARLNFRRVTLRNGKTLIYADSLATPDYLLINNKITLTRLLIFRAALRHWPPSMLISLLPTKVTASGYWRNDSNFATAIHRHSLIPMACNSMWNARASASSHNLPHSSHNEITHRRRVRAPFFKLSKSK